MRKRKISLQTEDQHISRYTLNLQSLESADPVVVSTHKVVVSPRKLPFIDRIISSIPKGVFRMEIQVMPDENLVVGNIDRLMWISVDTKTGNEIEDIRIKAHETIFLIYLDPKEIFDCKVVQGADHENDTFLIKYRVALYGEGDEEPWDELSETVELTFSRFEHFEPEFSFQPAQASFTYLRSKVQAGVLRVWNPGGFNWAPALDVCFGVKAFVDGRSVEGLVSLDEAVHATSFNGRALLNPTLEDGQDDGHGNIAYEGMTCDSIDDSGSDQEIKLLYVNKVVGQDGEVANHYWEIPVFLNMSVYNRNPISNLVVQLRVESRSRFAYDPSYPEGGRIREVGSVVLAKNRTIRDLDVYIKEGSRLTDLKGRQQVDIVARFRGWTDNGIDHLQYHLIIANSAQVRDSVYEDAGIHIQNLTVWPPVVEDGVTIHFNDGKTLSNGLFTFSGYPDSIDIRDDSAPLQIDIIHTDAYIAGMETRDHQATYHAVVKIPVSFEYKIHQMALDAPGSQSEVYNSFLTTLRFVVSKRPRPEWLCLDFGTSAIVAAFSRRSDDPDRLLKLKDEKDRVMEDTWAEESARTEDTEEQSDIFISSASVLKDPVVPASISQTNFSYFSSPVLLSPPSLGYMQYYDQLLPCLKSIVGYDVLPLELIPVGIRSLMAQNGDIKVVNILRFVYYQLFRLFLPEEARQTEQLILSVPNTFTPLNVKAIKEIARAPGLLPHLREDSLRSISESDAVAFFYSCHRYNFTNSSGDLIRGREDSFDDHVLVYDMGAGTLDITYFTQENVTDPDGNENTRIRIRGKMGVSKAGNYLDYLLASILVDRLCEQETIKEDQSWVDELKGLVDLTHRPSSMRNASMLKNYVRDHVKLMLDGDPEAHLPKDLIIDSTTIEEVEDITVEMIVSDPRFQEFLTSVSREVFEHFVNLFGYGPGSLPVDLVLFSGRMTGLLCLRRAVKDALSVLTPDPSHCLFADLSSQRFVDVDKPVTDVSGLKTAVVDGALLSCLSSTFELDRGGVFATYGLLMYSVTGQPRWIPLIDCHTECETVGNQDLYRGSTGSIYLRQFRTILVLQSYSCRTLEDWLSGKTELISVLGRLDIDTRAYQQGDEILLEMDTDSILHLYVGNQRKDLTPHDDFQNESFARSMWPIIACR